MPQTLLALLATMIVTLLSINQQRSLLETRRAMLDDEMEVMATGMALQALEYIGTKGFDAGAPSEPGHGGLGRLLSDANDIIGSLTAVFPTDNRCALSPLNEGAANYDDCNDLSDYNEMQWEDVPFQVGDHAVIFQARAEVSYYDQSTHHTTTTRTLNKQVTVTVRQAPIQGQRILLRNPVTVKRTFSY